MQKKYYFVLRDYLWIFASCMLYSFAFNCFFQPNELAMGGFSGIAQILHRFFPVIPVGAAVFTMNVPLMIVGVRKQGWSLLISSVFAISISSVAIDLIELNTNFQPMDHLLACLYGGGLMGMSLGLMFRKGATTGGTELAARLLKYRFRTISVGKLCLIIDVAVICIYAITFRNIDNALYGIISMYVSSLVMDMVVYGSVTAKLAYIISDKAEEIREKLMEMGLGASVIPAHGAYSNDRKDVLMCAVKPSKLAAIKTVVSNIDQDNAFIIVCDAREVFGEGFGSYSEDSL